MQGRACGIRENRPIEGGSRSIKHGQAIRVICARAVEAYDDSGGCDGPRSKISEMVRAINQIAEKYNVTICTFGHAGDGNLHPTCLTDGRNKEEMHLVEKAFEEIFRKAIELGGTITGEHGVGEMKRPYLSLKVGEEGVAAMKASNKPLIRTES